MTTLHPRKKLGITRCKSNSHIKLSQLVTINIAMLNTVQELPPAEQGRESLISYIFGVIFMTRAKLLCILLCTVV